MKIEDLNDVIYEKEENGICTLTFNTPKRRNALSYVSFLEIWTVLDDMEKDKDAKVLIMTGCEEAQAFSSGGYFNMKYITSIQTEVMNEIDLMDIAQKKLCVKMWNFNKPIIAAINGLAIGIGITMPLVGADLIYIAEDAWLGFYFVKRAVIPEFSSSFILPFLIGFQKAKEIIYFGDKISAQDAEKLGLVNKVLPPEELIPYVRKQALRLVPPKAPIKAIYRMKQTLHDYYKDAITKTVDLENKGLQDLFKTHDFRAATKSLITKKDPIFKGK